MSLLPCLCFVVASDKLDEILAAAQHTITSDSQGQKGHGGKRDRSKSIVSNEVRWEFWELRDLELRSHPHLAVLFSLAQWCCAYHHCYQCSKRGPGVVFF